MSQLAEMDMNEATPASMAGKSSKAKVARFVLLICLSQGRRCAETSVAP